MPMMLFEKQMLRKRSIIETVFDYLKNKFEMEHTRHRSVWNFLVHMMATLVTYSMKTTKPKV
ncbi:MAG: IS982 family transposase, partial [Alphaproteobacteria bacterium]|nr:IS982 family transposase [Alphaproteobacteria bacterium]